MTQAHVAWVRKVFEDADHASVTDLARWRGTTYLAFRHGHRHMPWPPGDVVVLASDDLERWEPRARISTGLDDRDPKLVPDGDRLWLFFGSHREERDADDRRHGLRLTWTHATWTEDGRSFALPRRVTEAGWWLWSPVRLADGFWSTGYGCDDPAPGKPHEVALFRSDDGLAWERHAALLGPGEGSEGALWRAADGRLRAVVRGTREDAFLLESDPPHREWSQSRLAGAVHAPATCEADGRRFVAGRGRDGEGRWGTRLWELGSGGLRPVVDLPSGGDCSYPGLLPLSDGSQRDALLVSWYSQHEHEGRPRFRAGERPAAVYLARVALA